MRIPKSFDIIGDIAILKFKNEKLNVKKRIALNLLKKLKNIRSVFEKKEKIKGRLRKASYVLLAGEKKSETLHKENKCIFFLDIKKVYFSPRLSNERIEIAREIRKKDKVLVMFSGIGPYALVIAKNSDAGEIYSIEINRDAVKYAKENLRLNKIKNVFIFRGDVKKIIPKLKKRKLKFDKIVMPRPKLKEDFLREAFLVSSKNTIVYFYDFLKLKRNEEIKEKIKDSFGKIYEKAKKSKRKIKIIRWKKAGEIAPYQYRIRIDFKVLN